MAAPRKKTLFGTLFPGKEVRDAQSALKKLFNFYGDAEANALYKSYQKAQKEVEMKEEKADPKQRDEIYLQLMKSLYTHGVIKKEDAAVAEGDKEFFKALKKARVLDTKANLNDIRKNVPKDVLKYSGNNPELKKIVEILNDKNNDSASLATLQLCFAKCFYGYQAKVIDLLNTIDQIEQVKGSPALKQFMKDNMSVRAIGYGSAYLIDRIILDKGKSADDICNELYKHLIMTNVVSKFDENNKAWQSVVTDIKQQVGQRISPGLDK